MKHYQRISIFFVLLCLFAVQGHTQTFPWIGSITPASGSGSSAAFSVVGYWGNPQADALYIWLKIGDQAHGCNVLYEIRNNKIYLMNDNGDNWGTAQPNGGAGSMSNSQCSFPLSSVSQSFFGSTVTGRITPTFSTSFAGPRAISAQALSVGSQSAWFTSGTWTVGNLPTITSLTPTSANSGTVHYTATATDPLGGADIQYISVSIGSYWGPGSLTVVSYPNSHGVLLMNDAGGGWITGAPYVNSQGTVSNFSWSVSGNTATIGFDAAASASFSGVKAVGAQVVNNASQYTQAFNLGTWTIPTGGNDVPTSSGTLEVTDILQTAIDPFSGAMLNVPTVTRPAPYLELTSPSGSRVAKLGDQLIINLSNVKPQTQVWIRETCLEDPNAIGGIFCGGGYVGMSTSEGTFTWNATVAPAGGYLGGHIYTVWVGNWFPGGSEPQLDKDIIGTLAMWFTNAAGSPGNPEMAAISNQ